MRRKAYPSDLTNSQWKRLKGVLPPAKPGGRPRSVDLREIIDGILYILRGGCAWRMMPHDLPPEHLLRLLPQVANDGLWRRINDTLRDQVRRRSERKTSPSMAIIDSQSVKTTEQGGPRGKGGRQDGRRAETTHRRGHARDDLGGGGSRRRHPGPGSRQAGVVQIKGRFPRLKKILADAIYNGGIAEGAAVRGLVAGSRCEAGAEEG